jgi:hypothetical protein
LLGFFLNPIQQSTGGVGERIDDVIDGTIDNMTDDILDRRVGDILSDSVMMMQLHPSFSTVHNSYISIRQ